MLRHLAIRHFAIVSEVEIDVAPGFTAITGETGAGKSILVDALGLILGARADSGLISPDSDQAEIEAVFELDDAGPAMEWLREQALAEGGELIIRRVLTRPSGSRAWINGRSATVGQLGELGRMLVEIHGQHEHQQLEKPSVQRRLLDLRVESGLVEAVRRAYADWRGSREDLESFERDSGDEQQLELLRFQARELGELDLAGGEYESLEQEQERLARSDDIRLAIAGAASALDGDDGPSARALLHQALQALDAVREVEPGLEECARMLEESRINVDEALASLDRLASDDGGDPERLDQVNRRLETALDLARKHRIQPERLPELTIELSERLERLENQGQRREALIEALQTRRNSWLEAAETLSSARREAAGELSKAVGLRLESLGMESAELRFVVERDDEAEPAPHGVDRVWIEFSANPGQPPQPLARVASGGELSRVALALMIAADRNEGPGTRIFDEVDAGVGGETAHVVGRFLREAARSGQAMCVTHLAQVAACADHQLQVRKEKGKQATALSVRSLDETERRREIARMLGSADSERSLAHAAELLGEKD
ncbi:MAG: DNA repair protein RecN [Gammaproteobacteria bacterium]|jgi:DNA repair protein RecN (Recombination protein N)|nr:DNA repair protein RecN [Gammaproteobacteria bacterium]NBD95423.1 DNA repair protein RecN [Gammaproteobacteria bacterium]